MFTINAEISQLKDDLQNPSYWLGDNIEKDVVGTTSPPQDRNTKVTLYAKFETPSDEKDVVEVKRYSADDLYAYSDAPVFGFCKKISELIKKTNSIMNIDEEDIKFEIKSIEFWKVLSTLKNYSNTSLAHDELISTYLIVAKSIDNRYLNRPKLKALLKTFELLEGLFQLSIDLLDKIHDLLEDAGFDLNYPMQFANDE